MITTFDRFDYLRRLIDAIIVLDSKPTEVVLINDGSSFDNSLTEKLSKLQKDLPSVSVVNSGYKKGANFCRNLGIELSSGEYITFMDDDDSIDPFFFSQFESQLVLDGYKDCYYPGRHFVSDADLNSIRRTRAAEDVFSFKHLLNGNRIGGTSGVTIRREVFQESGCLFDTSMPALQDYELWLRLCQRGYKFYPLQRSLIIYTEQTKGVQISRSVTRYKQAISKILDSGKIIFKEQEKKSISLALSISLYKTRIRSKNSIFYRAAAVLGLLFALIKKVIYVH